LDLQPSELVVLSSDQSELGFDLNVTKNGRYVLLIHYFTPDGDGPVELKVESKSEKGNRVPFPHFTLEHEKFTIYMLINNKDIINIINHTPCLSGMTYRTGDWDRNPGKVSACHPLQANCYE